MKVFSFFFGLDVTKIYMKLVMFYFISAGIFLFIANVRGFFIVFMNLLYMGFFL